jgi:hypothetical protein
VANGATSIATGDIADKRTWSSLASTVYDKVRVSKSGTQSIANSTDVQITFETETFDTNGLHSTSTNPSRFTAVKAGYYQVSVTVDWAVNATGIREVSIRKNGSTVSGNVTQAVTTATRPTRQTHSDIVSLAVGDYIEANVVQTSGGALNIDTGTYMSMVQLA